MNFHNEEEIVYFINEEKKTVVAMLTVPENAMGNEMLRLINKSSGVHFSINNCAIGKSIALKGRYKGKAVCHSEDDWDEKKGMHLAKLRALRAYAKDRERIAMLLSDTYSDILRRLERAEEYSHYATEHIEDAIENFD